MKRRSLRLIGLVAGLGFVAGGSSCGQPTEFTLATHREETVLAEIGRHLASVLERANGWQVEPLTGEHFDVRKNIGLVAAREVDFAITSSAVPTEDTVGVRTVLPLYPEILIVLYHESVGSPRSLEELVRGRRVGVGPQELLHSTMMLSLLRDFGFASDTFEPVYTPLSEMSVHDERMDVLLTFVGADRSRLETEIRRGARIFSFDDPQLQGRGSTVDGLLLKRPNLQSFVIPKNTFDRFPRDPVLTLSVTVTVITSSETSDAVVFDLVSGILENAHVLSQRNPLLGFLTGQIDEARLNFPLHEGTRQYLNRDQPSFLERYAEVIALLITLTVLGFGILRTGRTMLRRRKKERIDLHYERVQEIAARSHPDEESRREGQRELRELRARAVEQLRDERLPADESFTILLDLIQQALNELEDRHHPDDAD